MAECVDFISGCKLGVRKNIHNATTNLSIIERFSKERLLQNLSKPRYSENRTLFKGYDLFHSLGPSHNIIPRGRMCSHCMSGLPLFSFANDTEKSVSSSIRQHALPKRKLLLDRCRQDRLLTGDNKLRKGNSLFCKFRKVASRKRQLRL